MIKQAAQRKTGEMHSVEIHTPISMNEHFSVMCYLFVKSIAKNAELPEDWRVIFTVSGDSDLTPDSPQFNWAKDYPVEFRPVDPLLWKSMGYVGTGLQCITTPHVADVVLYMDADMIVIGSLAEVTRDIAGDHAIYGWPAWFSGDLPFNRLFEAAGIPNAEKYRIVLTDDGADYKDPWWACYFNFGFIGVSRDLANEMAITFPRDQAFVMEHFENYFAGQVALALNIVLNQYPYRILDERFNVGSDHPVALEFYEKKLGRPMFPSAIANEDPRVMHYCYPTPTLKKKRDMKDWSALRSFVKRPGLAGSEKVIQDALVKLDLFSHKDSYQRAYLSTHEQSGSTHSADRDDAKWQQTIARLEQRLANAQNRIRKLEQQAERWQNRANQLEKAYTQSLSWRITAPVRSLWRFFRSSVGS